MHKYFTHNRQDMDEKKWKKKMHFLATKWQVDCV